MTTATERRAPAPRSSSHLWSVRLSYKLANDRGLLSQHPYHLTRRLRAPTNLEAIRQVRQKLQREKPSAYVFEAEAILVHGEGVG